MTRTRQRALQGAFFGTATALGWVLMECAVGLHPGREITRQPFLYAYLLLGALVGFALFGGFLGRSEDHLLEANARLDEMAVSDPLTGLKNVRYFRARLAEAEAQARRSGEPLSLVVLDLDYFKQVNDRYGHETGDAVLRAVSAAIASAVREGDTAARVGAVARMGGEEFAVLLAGSGPDEAARVAERVLHAVRQCAVPAERATVRITASAGVAALHDGDGESRDVYARADQAMYAAKRAGRDRVSAWPHGIQSTGERAGRRPEPQPQHRAVAGAAA
jgi:diguanylate cyclase (GGDEF)-like protein